MFQFTGGQTKSNTQKPSDSLSVGLRYQSALPQSALARAALFRQNMGLVGFPALDFTAGGLFKSLGRAAVAFHLRHSMPPFFGNSTEIYFSPSSPDGNLTAVFEEISAWDQGRGSYYDPPF